MLLEFVVGGNFITEGCSGWGKDAAAPRTSATPSSNCQNSGDVSLKFPMSGHAFCESRPTYPRLQPASASASAKLQASAQPMRRLNSRTSRPLSSRACALLRPGPLVTWPRCNVNFWYHQSKIFASRSTSTQSCQSRAAPLTRVSGDLLQRNHPTSFPASRVFMLSYTTWRRTSKGHVYASQEGPKTFTA